MSKKIIYKNSPETEEAHNEIANLSSHIATLRAEKHKLDDDVSNHQAKSENFKKLEGEYAQMIADIARHREILTGLGSEVGILVEQKKNLIVENTKLEGEAKEKELYVHDIELYKKKSIAVRDEMVKMDQELLKHKNQNEAAVHDMREHLKKSAEIVTGIANNF